MTPGRWKFGSTIAAAFAATALLAACTSTPTAAPTIPPTVVVAKPTTPPAAPPTAAAAAPSAAAVTSSPAAVSASPAVAAAPSAVAAAASPSAVANPVINTANLQLVQPGTITAATQDTQAGFTQVNANGEREGFAIDIVNEAARRMNLKVTYTAMALAPLLPAVGTGQYDIGAIGLAVTDERKATVDYTEPYYYGFAGLLVKKSNPFNSLDDMAGKDVAVISNTVQATTLQGYPKINARSFDSQSNALAALRGGQVDAFLVGGADAENYAAQDSTLEVTQTLPSANPTAFPTAKGHTAFTDAMNQELNAMFADGTYKRLYSKWFQGPILQQMLDLYPVLKGQ